MAKPKLMAKSQLKKQVAKSSTKNNIKKKVGVTTESMDNLKKNIKKNLVKAQVKEEQKVSVDKTESKNVKPSQVLSEISAEKLTKAVELTHNLIKKREEKNTDKISLLDDEVPIILQIGCMKIPKCPLRTVRFALPHTLVNDSTEICLIVPDLKRGRKVDPEPTLIHYEDMLTAAGITNVKVLPFTQLKLEYSQFEAKRRLLSLYDVFLVDGKISGHVFHILGKVFVKARKLPTSVRLNEKDLKSEINKALSKASILLTPRGSTTVVKIGHNKMPVKQVTENIQATIKWLSANYPGGLENIQTLHVKAPSTLAIPVYCTLKSRNDVKIPIVVHHKKNMYHNVSGELSTILGATVSFDAHGNLKVKKDEVEGMSDEESAPKPNNLKKKANDQARKSDAKKMKRAEPEEDDESDDNEENINEESEEENASSGEVSAEEEVVIKSLRVPRNEKSNKKNKIKPAKKAQVKAPKAAPVKAQKVEVPAKPHKEPAKQQKEPAKSQKAPEEPQKAPAKVQKESVKAQKKSPRKDVAVRKFLKKTNEELNKGKVQKQKVQKKKPAKK